jgi:hypothetical protein
MEASGPLFCKTGTTVGFKKKTGNGEVCVGTGEYNAPPPFEGKRFSDESSDAYTKTGVLYSLEYASNNSTPALTVVKGVSGKDTMTITFKNEPSRGTNGSITDSEGQSVLAHIYATNSTGEHSAIGVSLASGANLTIDAGFISRGSDLKDRPIIAAYSSTDIGMYGNAVAIGTNNGAGATSAINFTVPASFYASSSSSYSYSGAAIFGAALGQSQSTANVSVDNVAAMFTGNKNELSASSSPSSGANGWSGRP